MNIYGGKQMAASFRTVRKNTIIIAEEIGEEHYGFRPFPASRSVAETLIHMATITRFPHQIHAVDHASDLSSFDFMGFFGGLIVIEKTPHTKHQVVGLLKEEGERYAGWLDSLSDEFLAEVVTQSPMGGGGTKTRFEMLLGPKEHEMHHRGQLMLTERLLGITPHLTRQFEERIKAMQAGKA